MKKNKKAESLVGIIIAVFILGFVLIGIMNIVGFSKDITSNYTEEINSYILQGNSENIMKKLDLSEVNTGDTFYIYKDTITKEFKIFTGSSNESYRYVNAMGENVDPINNIGKTYTREFIKDIDILKHTIQPNEIENLVFHLDATNIDEANNSTLLTDTGSVTTWLDLSGNDYHATNTTEAYKPTYYKSNGINGLAYIKFDGVDDILNIPDYLQINTDTTYSEKSIAVVLKIGFDIQSTQIIYEQGGSTNGYSIQIDSGQIYAGVWNTSWTLEQYKIVNLGEIVPDSSYFIMMIQNSSYGNDIDNNLQVYLNGKLINTLNNVDVQTSHADDTGIGAVNSATLRLSDNSSISGGTKFLKEGGIGELISWNHALSKDEIKGINQYFSQKWLNGKENVYYNVVKTNIKKY